MPTAAAISAIGGVAASGIGAWGASRAADQQQEAAMRGLALQRDAMLQQRHMWEAARGGVQPFIDAGTGASYSLADLYGLGKGGSGPGAAANRDNLLKMFGESPDFTFARDWGLRGVDFSLGAKGLTQSGAMARETAKYTTGLASQNLFNWIGNLQTIANRGANAAGTLMTGSANFGNTFGNTANAMANTWGNYGTAGASGAVGTANALGGGVQNFASNLGMWNLMNSRGGGGANPSSYAPTGIGPVASGTQYGLMLNG